MTTTTARTILAQVDRAVVAAQAGDARRILRGEANTLRANIQACTARRITPAQLSAAAAEAKRVMTVWAGY